MNSFLEKCGIWKKKDSSWSRSSENPCCPNIFSRDSKPVGALNLNDLRRGSCDPDTGAPKPGCYMRQGHKECHKYAYVTLATNDTYALGCLVLAESMHRVQTQHELVVMVTRQVSSDMRTVLRKFFNHVVQYDVLDSKDTAKLALLERPELGVTLTKLHCWTLIAYQKAVFLDADTMVVRNCDDIFENYEEFSAAPDVGWPDCFNSGVFVLQPSLTTYEDLLEFTRKNESFDVASSEPQNALYSSAGRSGACLEDVLLLRGGDQGILNMYFSDWPTADIKKHLPFTYNMVASILYSYRPAFRFFSRHVKIVHFLGPQKPWHMWHDIRKESIKDVHGLPHDTADLVKFWWKMFIEGVVPFADGELAGDAGIIVSKCRAMMTSPDDSESRRQREFFDAYAEIRSIFLGTD